MKRYIIPIISILILLVIYLNIETITTTFANILESKPKLVINRNNEYTKNYSFSYVSIEKDYIPYSYQDLLNIIYSTLNNGWDSFTFYCPKEYSDCLNDVKEISENNILLTNINNFVHPFNSFKNIKTIYDNSGEVTLKITKLYSEKQIREINKMVDTIIEETISNDMSDEEKIKTIHDYIINHTKYDVEKNDTGKSIYNSNIAYGPLIQGYGICGGYSDAMEIFLARFNIKNFKVASNSHVWNAVYVNNKWLNLDLTWDDPVASDNEDHLIYNYFLVTTEQIKNQDLENHDFDTLVYQELK